MELELQKNRIVQRENSEKSTFALLASERMDTLKVLHFIVSRPFFEKILMVFAPKIPTRGSHLRPPVQFE
jgi:hypothetical protein